MISNTLRMREIGKKYETGKNAGEAARSRYVYVVEKSFECKGNNWHSTRTKILIQ